MRMTLNWIGMDLNRGCGMVQLDNLPVLTISTFFAGAVAVAIATAIFASALIWTWWLTRLMIESGQWSCSLHADHDDVSVNIP